MKNDNVAEAAIRRPAQSLSLGGLLPVLVFAAVLALSYGYEIFSFNLTIDEDSTATLDSWARVLGSISEGRWAMAAMSLLLPNAAIPALSTGLGVLLSGIAWWIITRRHLAMPAWPAALAASLAGSVPVLAFIFSFSTVAFAIGIGNLLLLGFIAGIGRPEWRWRILGVIAAATAVAVYDSFIVAVGALALAYVWKKPQIFSALLAVGAAVAALIISKLVGAAAVALLRPIETPYIASFFDIPGLLAHPRGRLASALTDVWQTITLTPDRFGVSSPWLAVVILLLLVAACVSVWVIPGTVSERLLRAAALAGVIALPLAAEAVTSVLVLRSMLYLPLVILVLAAMSLSGISALLSKLGPTGRRVPKVAAGALILLAVLGNATISNRLFSTAATTYALDRSLAFEIGQQKELLLNDDAQGEEVPTVVLGAHSWQQGEFTTVRETFGLSLFSFGEARTIKFLHTHGVLTDAASPDESAAVHDISDELPVYPEPGWVSKHDGVLVINFGSPEGN